MVAHNNPQPTDPDEEKHRQRRFANQLIEQANATFGLLPNPNPVAWTDAMIDNYAAALVSLLLCHYYRENDEWRQQLASATPETLADICKEITHAGTRAVAKHFPKVQRPPG